MYQEITVTDNIASKESQKRTLKSVTEPYTGLTTDFHSLLYDALAEESFGTNGKKGLIVHNSLQLWYLARMLDTKGCGYADIDLDRAAATLQKGVTTIRRYIAKGQVKGIFRHAYKIAVGRWRIYYTSLFKLCGIANLHNWGATVEIDEDDLPRLKILAAEMTAKTLQSSSRYLATKDKKRGVPTVGNLLQTSLCCRGALGRKQHYGDRVLFVSADMPTFGVSQERIAAHLDRTVRTVVKRLSDYERLKAGLQPLYRRQIAKESDKAKKFMSLGFKFPKLFRSGDRFYESFPNVYAFDTSEDELKLTLKERNKLRRSNPRSFPLTRHLKSKKRSKSLYKKYRESVEMS